MIEQQSRPALSAAPVVGRFNGPPESFPAPLQEFGYVFSGADRILGLYGRLDVDVLGAMRVTSPLVCVTHCTRGPSPMHRVLQQAGRCGWLEDGGVMRRGDFQLVSFREPDEGWLLHHLVLSHGDTRPLDEHLGEHVPRHLAQLADAAPPGPPAERAALASGVRSALSRVYARRVVVYTGAGISQASGISTFAGEYSFDGRLGLTEAFPGEVVAWMLAQPDALVQLVGAFQARLATASPNVAHFRLARLEGLGHVAAVVSSNLDLLHERAGSRRVVAPSPDRPELADAEVLLTLGVSEDRYGLVAAARRSGVEVVAVDPAPPHFLAPGDIYVAGGAAGFLAAWLESIERRRMRTVHGPAPATHPVVVARPRRRSLEASVPSFPALLRTVLALSTSSDSTVHGVRHWRETAALAAELLPHAEDADRVVPLVFALVHDALRDQDGADDDHGARAARLAGTLNRGGVLALTSDQLELVAAACKHHSERLVTADPTIGVCWDADRLGLRRLRVTPDPSMLSLSVSQDAPAVVATAPPWSTLYSTYQRLCRRHG